MQFRLLSAWDAYATGDLTTSGLVKKVSIIYDHRVHREEQQEEEDGV